MTMPLEQHPPEAVKPLLTVGGEIAFLDVREFGQYGKGHPFFAVNLPYSRLEIEAPSRLPRKGTRIVLLDGGDGVAEMAAERFHALGYGRISAVAGGAPAWAAAGYTLFEGVNLLSKAFGEVIEGDIAAPSLTPHELKARLDKGENMVVLDGRPAGEFNKMNIPGALSCPNAELGYRLGMIAPDPKTTVIVNCAGRTRSIIGAQSLKYLRVPNPVHALENGTMGWSLAGLDLAHGSEPGPLPDVNPGAAAESRVRGDALMARYTIPKVDGARLAEWGRDETRTLYLFDVRTEEEFLAGHLKGMTHAPGGQLVQATDHWIAVRGARIVLGDDTGLRSAITALWLRAMGHDAYVLDVDAAAAGSDPAPAPVPDPGPDVPVVHPGELTRAQSGGGALLDLRSSRKFLASRIEGARWAIRPHLGRMGLEAGTDAVLCTDEPGVAALAAMDLRNLGLARISRLAGGPQEWRSAGIDVNSDPGALTEEERIDQLFFVHGRHDGDLEAARQYLEWETALLARLDAQEKSILNPPETMTDA